MQSRESESKPLLEVVGQASTAVLDDSMNGQPVNCSEIVKKYFGKFIVVMDTIPKALLSFTLIEFYLRDIGLWRILPAFICFSGNLFSVYKLFSPYIIGNMTLLPAMIKQVWKNRSVKYFRYFPVTLIIGALTANAIYIFSGMNIEGLNSTSAMLDHFSQQTSGKMHSVLKFLEGLLVSDGIRVSIVVFNMLVISLAFSAIHKHFVYDIPKGWWETIKRRFEPTKIKRKRIQLKASVIEYQKEVLTVLKSPHREGAIDSQFDQVMEVFLTHDEDFYQILKSLCQLNVLPMVDENSQHINCRSKGSFIISSVVSLSALFVFFLGTYAMKGNAQTINNILWGEGTVKPFVTNLMSYATRFSITAIWFENGYSPIKNFIMSLFTCKFEQTYSPRHYNALFLLIAFLSAGCSALVIVHAAIIALGLNRHSLGSLFGVMSIATAAFGPLMGDGAPTYNSLKTNHELKSQQHGSPEKQHRYKLFGLFENLNQLKKHIETCTKDNIQDCAAIDTRNNSVIN